jgi:predicted transcriptional regulator
MADTNTVELATELTIAWLGNPHTRVHADDVPDFLGRMHEAVEKLTAPVPAPEPEQTAEHQFTPAVSVRKSLASPEYIISMIDGRRFRSLTRHLKTNGLTPDEYRKRYGLKADYPMVAENYSHHRREMAKKIGLGRKPGQRAGAPAAAEATPTETAAPRRGRRKAAETAEA